MEAGGYCAAEKKQGRCIKCGSHGNQSWKTTEENVKYMTPNKLSMGELNWNGNRQPKHWIKNNRLYGVKVKLSCKSLGLESKLLLQLIKEKFTNLDKFPILKYHKIFYSPLFIHTTRISEKVSPINMACLKSRFPPFTKERGEMKVGGGRGRKLW